MKGFNSNEKKCESDMHIFHIYNLFLFDFRTHYRLHPNLKF